MPLWSASFVFVTFNSHYNKHFRQTHIRPHCFYLLCRGPEKKNLRIRFPINQPQCCISFINALLCSIDSINYIFFLFIVITRGFVDFSHDTKQTDSFSGFPVLDMMSFVGMIFPHRTCFQFERSCLSTCVTLLSSSLCRRTSKMRLNYVTVMQ